MKAGCGAGDLIDGERVRSRAFFRGRARRSAIRRVADGTQRKMWIHRPMEGKESRKFAIAEFEQIDRLTQRSRYPQEAGLLKNP